MADIEFNLDKKFIETWNRAVKDHVVTADELWELSTIALETPETDDNDVIRGFYLCDENPSFAQQLEHPDSGVNQFLDALDEAGLEIDNFSIERSRISVRRKGFFERVGDVFSGFERNGTAIAYARPVYDFSSGNGNGVHFDSAISHKALTHGLISPSFVISEQTSYDGGFTSNLGLGPRLHVFAPGLIQVYGGIDVNGVWSNRDKENKFGYSVNPILGGQIVFFYAGYTFPPIVGKGVRLDRSFEAGLRFGF
jgi:hypothetical protein